MMLMKKQAAMINVDDSTIVVACIVVAWRLHEHVTVMATPWLGCYLLSKLTLTPQVPAI